MDKYERASSSLFLLGREIDIRVEEERLLTPEVIASTEVDVRVLDPLLGVVLLVFVVSFVEVVSVETSSGKTNNKTSAFSRPVAICTFGHLTRE